jgi:hypothetical protein
MAVRPLFTPATSADRLVREVPISFVWHKGMASSQKKKNVTELHAAAALKGFPNVLEVSTKSEEKLGQRLSAFNLPVTLRSGRKIPLECAFQGGKVFEHGGPFLDLYDADTRDAKRDPRLSESGKLVNFAFEEKLFPLIPKTAFYDWLYISALHPHKDFLKRLERYDGFTDIEFNPERSINCQARSCATFVALMRQQLLAECVASPERFIEILLPDSIDQPHSDSERQSAMF